MTTSLAGGTQMRPGASELVVRAGPFLKRPVTTQEPSSNAAS